MGENSSTSNRYLLLVVNRAIKFAFAHPLRTKDAESVAKKLLDLLLLFGIPRSIRSDPGTEFMAEVVQHLCRWLKVSIDFGPPGRKEQWRGWGGGFTRLWQSCANPGRNVGTSTCNRRFGCNARRPSPGFRTSPPLISYCLDETCAHKSTQ